jgi:hypothetical protein
MEGKSLLRLVNFSFGIATCQVFLKYTNSEEDFFNSITGMTNRPYPVKSDKYSRILIIRSHIKHDVAWFNHDFENQVCNLPPINCPIKKEPINTGKVINSHPSPM